MDYQGSCGSYISTQIFFTSLAAPFSLQPTIHPYIFISSLHLCELPYPSVDVIHTQREPQVLTIMRFLSME